VWRATGVLYFISYVPEALAQALRKRDAWAPVLKWMRRLGLAILIGGSVLSYLYDT
jgi:hypothetical protein